MNQDKWVRFEALATDGSGDGSETFDMVNGILAMVDIVPDDSSSFDITIARVLPDGTERTFYSTTGVTAAATLGREDLTPNSIELAGPVKVTLANAGNHASAAKVYLTIV